jgi:hypothetical protein
MHLHQLSNNACVGELLVMQETILHGEVGVRSKKELMLTQKAI